VPLVPARLVFYGVTGLEIPLPMGASASNTHNRRGACRFRPDRASGVRWIGIANPRDMGNTTLVADLANVRVKTGFLQKYPSRIDWPAKETRGNIAHRRCDGKSGGSSPLPSGTRLGFNREHPSHTAPHAVAAHGETNDRRQQLPTSRRGLQFQPPMILPGQSGKKSVAAAHRRATEPSIFSPPHGTSPLF